MRGQLRSEPVTARDGTRVDVDLWMPDSYHEAPQIAVSECGGDAFWAEFSRRGSS